MTKVKMELPKEEVKTDVAENVEKQDNAYSYDELMNIAMSLDKQCREFKKQLDEARLANFFTRLDFLFKVTANKDAFPGDFVKKVVEEICDLLTLEEKEDKPTE